LTDAGSPAHGFCRFASWEVALAAFLIALAAGRAHAQAWVPPAGSGSLNFVVQTIDNTGHISPTGALLPIGKSHDASVYMEGEYAWTDRLSVSLGVPYVFARYIGPDPTPGPQQPLDACHCWNHGWQDVGATVRYSLVNDAFAVTPMVSVGVPSNGYVYRGEAVVGRNLKEVRLGVAVGQRLDALTPRLSVQGSYSYAIVQKVVDVPNNRSNVVVDGGFAVTRRLSIRGGLSWQRTHGGLRPGTGPPPVPNGYPWGEITTADLFAQHDRILRDNSLHAGFGASYSLQNVDLFTSYLAFVSGTSTHAGRAFTLGISWPFELGR
jgi:hypothetical protein